MMIATRGEPGEADGAGDGDTVAAAEAVGTGAGVGLGDSAAAIRRAGLCAAKYPENCLTTTTASATIAAVTTSAMSNRPRFGPLPARRGRVRLRMWCACSYGGGAPPCRGAVSDLMESGRAAAPMEPGDLSSIARRRRRATAR